MTVTVTWETHPLTPARFDDFADVINPNRRESHCWCLSHRCSSGAIRALGSTRAEAAAALVAREQVGVITYADGVPVGWCSVGPRAANERLSSSKLIRPIDDLDVWSIICVVVRAGHRKRGVTGHLIEGAVVEAAEHGAPAVEAYPVDPVGRMDLTMAFVGTRSMFERAGFEVVGMTDAVASKMPRLIMRRTL